MEKKIAENQLSFLNLPYFLLDATQIPPNDGDNNKARTNQIAAFGRRVTREENDNKTSRNLTGTKRNELLKIWEKTEKFYGKSGKAGFRRPFLLRPKIWSRTRAQKFTMSCCPDCPTLLWFLTR